MSNTWVNRQASLWKMEKQAQQLQLLLHLLCQQAYQHQQEIGIAKMLIVDSIAGMGSTFLTLSFTFICSRNFSFLTLFFTFSVSRNLCGCFVLRRLNPATTSRIAGGTH